jgi:hypothetical protein
MLERNLLITPTLLNSLDWYRKCPPNWRERAFNSISSTLNRAPFEPSPIMLLGNELEDAVYKWSRRAERPPGASSNFVKLCDYVRGMTYQKKAKKIIEHRVDQFDVTSHWCLFGRLDFTSPKLIVDLKATANYKGAEKYLAGHQHLFYTYMEQVTDYVYLVAEVSEKSKEIRDVHEVKFVADDFDRVERQILDGIEELIQFLLDHDDLMDAYLTKFCKY